MKLLTYESIASLLHMYPHSCASCGSTPKNLGRFPSESEDENAKEELPGLAPTFLDSTNGMFGKSLKLFIIILWWFGLTNPPNVGHYEYVMPNKRFDKAKGSELLSKCASCLQHNLLNKLGAGFSVLDFHQVLAGHM